MDYASDETKQVGFLTTIARELEKIPEGKGARHRPREHRSHQGLQPPRFPVLILCSRKRKGILLTGEFPSAFCRMMYNESNRIFFDLF